MFVSDFCDCWCLDVGADDLQAMFEPRENPGVEKLIQDARDMVAGWLRNDWYESSSAGAVRP